MNARLEVKLARCRPVTALAAPPRAGAVKLLGHGIDAIILHTRRPAWGFLRLFLRGRPDPKLPTVPDELARRRRYRAAMRLQRAGMLSGGPR